MLGCCFGQQAEQRITSLSITGVGKSYPQGALETMLYLTPLDLYVRRCAARNAIRLRESGCWKLRSIGHSRFLNVVFPDGRYGLSGKTTEYIVIEAMFLV